MSDTDRSDTPRRKKFSPPAPVTRDFDLEKIAVNQILDALQPFHPEVQSTLLRTVVVFKGIYIPHD